MRKYVNILGLVFCFFFYIQVVNAQTLGELKQEYQNKLKEMKKLLLNLLNFYMNFFS